VKYTSNGNNFVIIDETENKALSEEKKKAFAKKATDINFGIGCDNLIVIQKFCSKTLESINEDRNYWKNIPNNIKADFIFRMLEPDGNEALSCGNGLLCIADYLYKKYHLTKTEILTEIPSIQPKLIKLGTDSNFKKSYVNMGAPSRVPASLVNRSLVKIETEEIDKIHNVKVNFRSNDLNFLTNMREVTINGYLVFTGEPHLVVFVDNAFSVECIKKFFFIKNQTLETITHNFERRASFGKWLVNHIGFFLNKKNFDIFPSGINVNFAKIMKKKQAIIEYRTYERGINHETLSCGTGAIAVAYIAKKLNLIESKKITLMPYSCRLYDNEAKVVLKQSKKEWVLFGAPKLLFKGEYCNS